MMDAFRRGLVWALLAGVVVYVVLALLAGWRSGDTAAVAGTLARFSWPVLAPILLMSLGNYAVRFARWEMYLRRLDVRVPLWTSASVFGAGLAMTITPGKVGEFLKSYLLRETDGIPMSRTAPVVFMERVTDLLALVALASVGVGSYFAGGVWVLLGAGAALVAGLGVLQSSRLSLAALRPLRRVRRLRRLADGLEASYLAARALIRPAPLLIGLALGVAGWACECLGFHLCFVGLDQPVPAGVSFFAYAFSTIAGVVSPGGLGATDVGLVGFTTAIVPDLEESTAVAAAFLVRAATLWFAIGIGAAFLLRFSGSMRADVEAVRAEASGRAGPGASPGPG